MFVLSTHREGLPLAVLEAMACGKPVVATSVDGIPEIVENGRTGLLFPHQDDRQLAVRILALLGDPRMAAELGDSARRFVEAQFTTKQFASSMNKVYSQLLGA